MRDGSRNIPMKPQNPNICTRLTISFPNARTAFKAFLRAQGLTSKNKVLLPAYVGWSRREGSGVFDPIQEIGVDFAFYRLKRDLTIDLEDLRRKLNDNHVRLLVIIHYFGYPDPCYPEAVAYAQNLGIAVIEDEAHALYSDWVSGICGRLGDAAFFSLHKMLPFDSGGLLVLNNPTSITIAGVNSMGLSQSLEQGLLSYDFYGISQIRRRNAFLVLEAIARLTPEVIPLWPMLPEGVVPQTLPVLVTHYSRDELYYMLNQVGFGVVSLYHTLISPIRSEDFPDSHWVSQRILNLPVHQDATPEALKAMVDCLAQLVGRH